MLKTNPTRIPSARTSDHATQRIHDDSACDSSRLARNRRVQVPIVEPAEGGRQVEDHSNEAYNGLEASGRLRYEDKNCRISLAAISASGASKMVSRW